MRRPERLHVHYGLARCAGDERLLRLPRLSTAAAGSLGAARLRGAIRPVRAGRAAGRGHAIRHNLERPAPPAWARALGALAKRGSSGGRIRRRLRDRRRLHCASRIALRWSSRRSNGRYPADARSPGGTPAPAARLHGDRAAGAPRAAPFDAYRAPVRACPRGVRRSARVQRSRGRGHRRVDRAARRKRAACRSSRSVSTRTRSVRRTRPPRTTSYPSAPIRTGTSSCFSRSLGGSPTSASRSSPRRRARASSPMSPANVTIEVDLPFEQMRERLERARVVALPVRENTYSGATTVLLQAMALEKPVVVSRTSAIATGYGLVDGENCRLVAPGDAASFAEALGDILRDDVQARSLGRQRTKNRRARPVVGAVRRADRGDPRSCCGG